MSFLNVTFNDLPENQRDIAEAIGMEAFANLTKLVGGSNPYIMVHSEFERIATDKQIIDEFNGDNFTQLALKYGYSVRTIYKKIPQELRTQRNRNNGR